MMVMFLFLSLDADVFGLWTVSELYMWDISSVLYVILQ